MSDKPEVQQVRDAERVYISIEGSVASTIRELEELLLKYGPETRLEYRLSPYYRRDEDAPQELWVTWMRPETTRETEARLRLDERMKRVKEKDKKRQEAAEQKLYEKLAKKYAKGDK